MSVTGLPLRLVPVASSCWSSMGADFPAEFPSTFQTMYQAPLFPETWKPDAPMTPPFARSHMSGFDCGANGPAGLSAVATPMQWSLLGLLLWHAVSVKGGHSIELGTVCGVQIPPGLWWREATHST